MTKKRDIIAKSPKNAKKSPVMPVSDKPSAEIESKSKGRRVSRVCGVTNRQKKYAQRRVENPTETKRNSLAAAGYSPNTVPAIVEATNGFKDLQQRIEAAQAATGWTPEYSLKKLKNIADNGEKDTDKIAAIKTAIWITGERMPERVVVAVEEDTRILQAMIMDD